MTVKVEVEYCGGWGYGSRYRRLESELKEEFEDEVEVSGKNTSGITGWFEVTVDGKLVHSKKNGEGYVDSDAKLNKIKDAIRAALK